MQTIGVIADTWGISFRKVGSITAYRLMKLGHSVAYLDGRIPLLATGKWNRVILVADTVYAVAWGWHRYFPAFFEKGIFWTDTPISLEYLTDEDVDIINSCWCNIAVSRYNAEEMKKIGLKVYGIVGRPINSDEIEKARRARDDAWRRKYGRYILVVASDVMMIAGHAHPRKGLDRFDEAIGLIRSDLHAKGIKVVAVTNLHLRNTDYVIRSGFLSEQELYQLIRQAELFVFPSRLEGFGIPPLEAMALEKLVVYTDAPSHNEHTVGIKVEDTYPIRECRPEIGGRCWTVYDYEASKLADAILYAIDLIEKNPQYVDSITRKAREEAVKYYDTNIIPKLLKV